MNLSDVGPVAFFWGTIFALGAHSRLGAQKLPSMRILPSHSGKDQKKKNKSLPGKCTPVASVLLLSFGARFLLGRDTVAWGHKNLRW